MRFGGGNSADVYFLVSGYKLRDYGLRKSDVSWPARAKSHEALECSTLVYSLRLWVSIPSNKLDIIENTFLWDM